MLLAIPTRTKVLLTDLIIKLGELSLNYSALLMWQEALVFSVVNKDTICAVMHVPLETKC